MHVCIDYRPALREGTGVGTYVRGLLGGLVRRHVETAYTAFSASWRDRLQLPAGLHAVRPADAHVPTRVLDRLWHRHGWPPVDHWAGAHDVAHSPSPLLMPTRGGARVVTVHDCYFLREPERMTGIVRRDYVPQARAAAAAADAILTVSKTTRDEVLELLGVSADRVHVTYNGGSENYAPVPDARRIVADRLGIERPFVLFAGRREYRKDLPTLLAAFDRLREPHPELALVLVGPDGDTWEATWAAALDRIRDQTHILEHQPAQQLGVLYSAARVLALPSRWEGFGLTGIEAMACGTPVVAARAGAMPEIYGDAAAWFPAGDIEALTEVLDTVLTDTDRRSELVQAGRDRARRFTWDATADLTHDVYAEVAP